MRTSLLLLRGTRWGETRRMMACERVTLAVTTCAKFWIRICAPRYISMLDPFTCGSGRGKPTVDFGVCGASRFNYSTWLTWTISLRRSAHEAAIEQCKSPSRFRAASCFFFLTLLLDCMENQEAHQEPQYGPQVSFLRLQAPV